MWQQQKLSDKTFLGQMLEYIIYLLSLSLSHYSLFFKSIMIQLLPFRNDKIQTKFIVMLTASATI